MICPYLILTDEKWSESVDMGFVCTCGHPGNAGGQHYVRNESPAGRKRPSKHCRPDCRHIAGTAIAAQWHRELDALAGGCCGD